MTYSRSESTPPAPAKRRRELHYRSKARKKHKRLDAIHDEPTASYIAHRNVADDDTSILRRSSRVRRPPELLDSSPVPFIRRKRFNDLDSPCGSSEMKRETSTGKEKEEAAFQAASSRGEDGDWMSRLRTRDGNGREKLLSSLRELNASLNEAKTLLPVMGEKNVGMVTSFRSSRRWKKISPQAGNKDDALPLVDKDYAIDQLAERIFQEGVAIVPVDVQLASEAAGMMENTDKVTGFTEEAECVKKCIHDGRTQYIFAVDDTLSLHSQGTEENGSKDHDSSQYDKHPESIDAVERDDALKDNSQATEHTLKDNGVQAFVPVEKVASLRVKEGRRCGLCGCGTDGKPPKKLVNESFDSENEAYDGSTASDEPNYNVWDGFGDEPGWLGRLLGPLLDRFGIARVWVHQHCAVWSPEVYFADLGCLKNVRAALCRGRALKCSRCGRPGATIGCRVDRCPKTYHLPCSRIEGCIFDHHKFLIACSDHRRFFQPYGHKHALQIRKMKAKKSRLDLRKVSNEARRKDLEAEEKWLENCGEDEEFLRREGRRLHRDILRIAPIYIGGSSENENMYQGWESVAGLEHVIQCMKEVVLLPLLYPEFFINLGLVPPRGILLHGNPGTGKTHVVRALIGACSRGDKRIAYFARKGADCLGKYVGDAERQLRLLFQVAEKSQPSIIFFDEIDGLAPCRSKQQDQTHSSVVSTLLSLLDGLKSRGSVIVIGATNRPDAVDPALRRPGRFDREIYFPLPTEKDRSSILSLHTRSWPKPLSGSLLLWIANQTVGFAGADLQALCAQAAMYALKRNCALQKLLSYAAKGTIQGKLPSLPSFHVEERDWLAALTLVPPPCSRREAGIAVNDIVASPLPVDLISCLLLPLAKLLVSLYIDEQVCLSPMLFMASKSVKNVVVSALEQKGVPVTFWWSHLDALIQEPLFAEKIKNKLVQYGLVNCPSGFNYLISLDEVDDEPSENETVDSIGMRTCGALVHRKLMQKSLLQVGKSRGFRIIISGAPRCGQQHLASCLLQGFMRHKEILKVSLATISQEGHGDMILGLSHILLKCLDIEQCIIFMPRIDLWAIEETSCPNTSEGQLNPERKISVSEGVTSLRKGTSEMWNLFVELVDSAVTAASLTIMATCEAEKSELSPGILSFFSQNVCGHTASIPTECTIPRFFFHIGANLDLDLVITSAAEKLSFDIIQLYIKLVHDKTHERFSGDKSMHKCSLADTIPEAYNKQNSTQEASARKDNMASNNNKSLQESFPKAGRVLKGNLCSAISAFGHQILRCPKFAELVWVTSKLKEGPSTDASGPWKRWLFNTCVMHRDDGSPSKRSSGTNPCNSSSNYDMESPGVVRGLIAVGLLACRGFYTSIWEISSDVRKVLELLVGQIREKMFGRKGQYRYFEVLSQVAYLDDMVNSWVYMLQSLEADSNIAEVNFKPAVEEDEYLKTAKIEKSSNTTSDIPLEGLAANTNSNGEFSNPCLEELVDYIMLSNKSTDDSNSNCRYKCCPGCVIAVRAMARQIISDDLKKSNECCTTADDAHDIVTSCSMRVLDSFRKCFFCSANSGDDGNCYYGNKRMACGCESAGLLPEECCCHTSSSLSLEEESDKLTYFFRNGVLLQLAQQPEGGDPELHCKFESLCMCLLPSNDVCC